MLGDLVVLDLCCPLSGQLIITHFRGGNRAFFFQDQQQTETRVGSQLVHKLLGDVLCLGIFFLSGGRRRPWGQ